jgi:hypothetical protein
VSLEPSKVSDDLEELLDDARRSAGLDDFGDDVFREGLQVLLDTYDRNDYDEAGIRQCHARLSGLLAERLRIEHAWATHPEIRDVPITSPMFLTGLPRTGTSALLNLLAQDPAMRPMALWEGINPSPLPGNPAKEDDPRYTVMKEFLDHLYEKSPDFGAIHHTTADTPEECVHLLNHTFADVQFGVEVLMEPYASWFRAQDHRASYRYYADILRMLAWQRPGERFLLKTPAHLWALEILVEMFPDCSIIITHRDPLECVASYASMMEALMNGRTVDPRELGPVVMEYLAAKMDHAMACREQIDPDRIIDVQYTDLLADPAEAARTIYDHFSIPATAELERAWADHVGTHPQGEHGSHDYSLAGYGLTEGQVRDRFAAYLESVPL